jgi:hypothetical protein
MIPGIRYGTVPGRFSGDPDPGTEKVDVIFSLRIGTYHTYDCITECQITER